MILRKEIITRATEWGVTPDTVDKDYVLGHFLNSFYNDEIQGELFVFKGGTCLRKCYFPGYRFSEDLDFTLLDKSFRIDVLSFEQIAAQCENNTGIQFWVKGVENKQFNDEAKGYKCRIGF